MSLLVKIERLMSDSGSLEFLALNLRSYLLGSMEQRLHHDSVQTRGTGLKKSIQRPGFMRLPDGNRITFHWKDRYEVSYIVNEIYRLGVYHHMGFPHEGETVIDVGGHIGIFTLHTATKVGTTGRVIAVEPSPDNFRMLNKNVKSNRLKNVTPVCTALADLEGTGKLFLDGSGRHSLLSRGADEYVETPMITLDQLIENQQLKQIDLLKIDVEGSEMKVLKGGANTLKNKIKRLVIASYHYPTEVEEITEYLKSVAPRFNVKVFTSREDSPDDRFLYANS
jgi:FkbM family methyltransferase